MAHPIFSSLYHSASRRLKLTTETPIVCNFIFLNSNRYNTNDGKKFFNYKADSAPQAAKLEWDLPVVVFHPYIILCFSVFHLLCELIFYFNQLMFSHYSRQTNQRKWTHWTLDNVVKEVSQKLLVKVSQCLPSKTQLSHCSSAWNPNCQEWHT